MAQRKCDGLFPKKEKIETGNCNRRESYSK